ncbi:ComEA family DNA-binding protein [Leuconostoc fallax]
MIAYRTENNGFKQIEDIKKVSGIGDKRFEK